MEQITSRHVAQNCDRINQMNEQCKKNKCSASPSRICDDNISIASNGSNAIVSSDDDNFKINVDVEDDNNINSSSEESDDSVDSIVENNAEISSNNQEDNRDLSPYERLRLERIQRNKEYLARLGLDNSLAIRENKQPSNHRKANVSKNNESENVPVRKVMSRKTKAKPICYAEPSQNVRSILSGSKNLSSHNFPEISIDVSEQRSERPDATPELNKIDACVSTAEFTNESHTTKKIQKPKNLRMEKFIWKEMCRIKAHKNQVLKDTDRLVRAAQKEVRLWERLLSKWNLKVARLEFLREKANQQQEAQKRRKAEADRIRAEFEAKQRKLEEEQAIYGSSIYSLLKEISDRRTELEMAVMAYDDQMYQNRIKDPMPAYLKEEGFQGNNYETINNKNQFITEQLHEKYSNIKPSMILAPRTHAFTHNLPMKPNHVQSEARFKIGKILAALGPDLRQNKFQRTDNLEFNQPKVNLKLVCNGKIFTSRRRAHVQVCSHALAAYGDGIVKVKILYKGKPRTALLSDVERSRSERVCTQALATYRNNIIKVKILCEGTPYTPRHSDVDLCSTEDETYPTELHSRNIKTNSISIPVSVCQNEALAKLFFGRPDRCNPCARCSLDGFNMLFCRVTMAHSNPDFDWFSNLGEVGGVNGLLHALRTGQKLGETEQSNYHATQNNVEMHTGSTEDYRMAGCNFIQENTNVDDLENLIWDYGVNDQGLSLEDLMDLDETELLNLSTNYEITSENTVFESRAELSAVKNESSPTKNAFSQQVHVDSIPIKHPTSSTNDSAKPPLLSNTQDGTSDFNAHKGANEVDDLDNLVDPTEFFELAKNALTTAQKLCLDCKRYVEAPTRLGKDFIDATFPVDDEDGHFSYCVICGLAGNLLCCDGCKNVVHSSCVGLIDVPEGDWFCEECGLKTKDEFSLSTSTCYNEANPLPFGRNEFDDGRIRSLNSTIEDLRARRFAMNEVSQSVKQSGSHKSEAHIQEQDGDRVAASDSAIQPSTNKTIVATENSIDSLCLTTSEPCTDVEVHVPIQQDRIVDSTVKRKRGRPRKYPSPTNPNDGIPHTVKRPFTECNDGNKNVSKKAKAMKQQCTGLDMKSNGVPAGSSTCNNVQFQKKTSILSVDWTIYPLPCEIKPRSYVHPGRIFDL